MEAKTLLSGNPQTQAHLIWKFPNVLHFKTRQDVTRHFTSPFTEFSQRERVRERERWRREDAQLGRSDRLRICWRRHLKELPTHPISQPNRLSRSNSSWTLRWQPPRPPPETAVGQFRQPWIPRRFVQMQMCLRSMSWRRWRRLGWTRSSVKQSGLTLTSSRRWSPLMLAFISASRFLSLDFSLLNIQNMWSSGWFLWFCCCCCCCCVSSFRLRLSEFRRPIAWSLPAFTFSEVGFFRIYWKWYDWESHVRFAVLNDRLSFIHGGKHRNIDLKLDLRDKSSELRWKKIRFMCFVIVSLLISKKVKIHFVICWFLTL